MASHTTPHLYHSARSGEIISAEARATRYSNGLQVANKKSSPVLDFLSQSEDELPTWAYPLLQVRQIVPPERARMAAEIVGCLRAFQCVARVIAIDPDTNSIQPLLAQLPVQGVFSRMG